MNIPGYTNGTEYFAATTENPFVGQFDLLFVNGRNEYVTYFFWGQKVFICFYSEAQSVYANIEINEDLPELTQIGDAIPK